MGNKFRFTKKSIDALPPCPADSRSREVEYSDCEIQGLHLLVGRTGRKAFLFRYTSPAGRKRSMGLGSYPEFDIVEAREKALDVRRLLARGFDPQDVREEKKRETLRFREFVESDYKSHYLANLRSHQAIETRLRLHIYPAFGDKPLTSITTLEIQRLHDRLRLQKCPATANRILALVKRVFNLAILWGKMEGPSPAQRVKMCRENNQRHRYLAGEELSRFLAALDAEPCRLTADFFGLLIATGVRRSEALQAKWEDVHLESARWFLPQTKTGSRTVHLNEMALEILRNRARVDGNLYVFPSNKIKGAHLSCPNRGLTRILKRAGITNLRTHDLRHSHASLAIAAGASLYVVQHLLGHRNSTTTARYAHLGDLQLKQSSAKVSDILSLASKPPQAST